MYTILKTIVFIAAKCGYLGGQHPPGLELVEGRGAGQWSSGGSCGMAGHHTNL